MSKLEKTWKFDENFKERIFHQVGDGEKRKSKKTKRGKKYSISPNIKEST